MRKLIISKIKKYPIAYLFIKKIYFLLITRHKCINLDIFSHKEYQQLFPHDIKTSEISTTHNTVHASLKFYPDYVQDIKVVNYPSILFYELEECSVIGNSNIIIDRKNRALYNENVGKNQNNLDPALQVGWEEYPTIGKSKYILVKEKSQATIPEAISFINSDIKNYFHYTHDVLVKFWAISKLNLKSDVPIIINSEDLKIPQFKELLDLFNTDNRKIIPIEPLQRLSLKNLYVISPIKITNGAPRHWTECSFQYPLYNFEALDFIRNVGLNYVNKCSNNSYERIFISRKNYTLRSYNESEIEDILKEKGFVTIYPESLSIQEQISIFSKAKVIVAASGAALTNILYCNKNTTIIVFLNKILSMPIFSSICYRYGSNLIYIAADKVDNPDYYHTSMHINPKDVENVLKELNIS